MSEQVKSTVEPSLAPDIGPLARLAESVEPEDSDACLEAFLDYVTELGIELYEAQEEAVLEVMSNKHIILNTPTGSGKSLVAVAMHFKAFCDKRRSFYTCPIKALVSEKFFSLCQIFGAEHVGMMTGDASINRDAPIICCTAEILSNMGLRQGEFLDVDFVIMDEFHYYSDRDRGIAWQIPLITMPETVFMMMSATLGDVSAISERLQTFTDRGVAWIRSAIRPVPLDYQYAMSPVHETIERLVSAQKAPVYMVNFTQRECAERAQNLMSSNYCSKEEKRAIGQVLKGHKFDSPYGKTIRRFVSHGVGLHHAGLLPKYRLMVEELAKKGHLKVIVGTDTLGVGINIPLRTVLFTKLCKFDGLKVGILTVRDFKQISGRAGRKGFDEEGSVVCQAPEHVIENKRLADKAASAQKGRKSKYVKAKPPTKGYVAWNEATFQKLIDNQPEPLESRFQIRHGMILNLMQRDPETRDGGYRRLIELIGLSHLRPALRTRARRHSALLFKELHQAGLIEVKHEDWAGGSVARVSDSLQRDFSLNHSLSLYLVETLAKLDPESESYHLDVLTLVEAILENPRVVLYKQVSKIKGELVGAMKAEGIPYEERMEKLEDVSYPRPNKNFVYDTFNNFQTSRPWLTDDSIRPKSIARDMFERYASFTEYVVEYGLQQSEGVLLRYLTSAYKALIQSVPEMLWNDAMFEMIAFLRSTLERVDSSLVQAWERMLDQDDESDGGQDVTEREIDIAQDKRVFMARIRADLQHLARALSRRDYQEVAESLRPPEEPVEPWSAKAVEAAIAPFYEGHEKICFNHEARLTDKTIIALQGPRLWEVQQILVDPEGENEWAIVGNVDLRGVMTVKGPLVRLDRIEG